MKRTVSSKDKVPTKPFNRCKSATFHLDGAVYTIGKCDQKPTLQRLSKFAIGEG